jgi:hypothetical protein
VNQVIDARPSVVDLRVYAGDDLHLAVVVLDSSGGPEDLTGCTAEAQVRTTVDDETTLATFVTDVVDNTVYLHLAAADSATLPDTAVWDVQVTYPDTTVATLARGKVTLTKEVTR